MKPNYFADFISAKLLASVCFLIYIERWFYLLNVAAFAARHVWMDPVILSNLPDWSNTARGQTKIGAGVRTRVMNSEGRFCSCITSRGTFGQKTKEAFDWFWLHSCKHKIQGGHEVSAGFHSNPNYWFLNGINSSVFGAEIWRNRKIYHWTLQGLFAPLFHVCALV